MHLKGKGQLTIFVILGLVLVVIVGLGIMLFQSTSSPEQSGSVDTQQAVSFVESCLEREATNALYDLGQSGGSIEGLNFEEQPWRGEAFVNGPQEVKYWYHMESCGKEPGCLRFAAPPLCEPGECIFDGQYQGAGESLQVTAQRMIEESIVSCVGDFSGTNFELLNQEQPDVSVIFTADDVQVSLNYPLQLRNQETSEMITINDFATSLDVDFEEVYRLARDITALQYQTQFVENNFLHFLSLYQGDPPLLPPFNDAELFGGQKIWIRTQVQEQLETEILPYLSFMQIVNAYAGYRPIIETGVDDEVYGRYAQGLFKYSEIIIPDVIYPNHAVQFLYPHSDIYLNINDREVLKGKSMDGGNFFMKLAGVFMKEYKHRYDVAWPMVTTVSDPRAFGGAGYSLNFGLEANIVNNAPMTVNRTILTIDERGEQMLDPGEPQNHAQGNINIKVIDKRTGEAVPEAMLTYECGWGYQLPQKTNSQGEWSGTLPYCAVGGQVRAEVGLEYYPNLAELNSVGEDNSVELSLWPYQEKEVEVYKISKEKVDLGCSTIESCRESLEWENLIEYDFNGTNATATENQYALLTINRIPDELADPVPLLSTLTFGKDDENVFFSQESNIGEYLDQYDFTEEEVAIIESQSNDAIEFEATLSNSYTVRLIPADYRVEGLLFYEGNLTIPEEGKKPELQLPSWLQGGVLHDSVSFSEQDIYGDNKLVFYVLENPLPQNWDDMEEYVGYRESQEEYLTWLQPRFE